MYRRTAVLAALVLIGGCAATTARRGLPDLPPPTTLSVDPPWLELTTERFVLRTDLDGADARAAAGEFEAAYLYLEQVAFPGYEHLAQRVGIVLFRSASEFHSVWPSDMAGIYLDHPPQAIERAPTIALFGAFDAAARRIFLHELTHRFIAREYGWVPAWLNEGLAGYFSTMRVEDGRAILGVVPPGVRIESSVVPSVQELVTADHVGFYGEWTGQDDGGLHRLRYYAGAYSLVHLLRHGSGERRRSFDAFLAAMNDGARADQAWARTLGTLSDNVLEQAFRAHLDRRQDWDLVTAPVQPPSAAQVAQVRAMNEVEVHLQRASLVDASGDGAKDVQKQLDEAQAEAPRSPEVAYARGCFELSQQRVGRARGLFEDALAREPNNPRYLHAVIKTRLLGADRSHALDGLLAHLDRVATSADQMAEVAEYDSAMGDHDGGLRHVEAAVAADPGYGYPLAVRARIHFEAGEFAAAVADQERALAMLPENANARPLAQTLAEYRHALSKDRPTGK